MDKSLDKKKLKKFVIRRRWQVRRSFVFAFVLTVFIYCDKSMMMEYKEKENPNKTFIVETFKTFQTKTEQNRQDRIDKYDIDQTDYRNDYSFIGKYHWENILE